MSIPVNITAADAAITAPVPVQTKSLRPESSQLPKSKLKNAVAPPELFTPEDLVHPVALTPPPGLEPAEAVAASNPVPTPTDAIAAPETLTTDQRQRSGPPVAALQNQQQSETPPPFAAPTDAISAPETLTSELLIQWSGLSTVTPQTHEQSAVEDLEDLTDMDDTGARLAQIEQYTVEGLTGAVLGSSETLDPLVRSPLVHQLSDVKSTDWAAKTLHSLAERHNCPAGHRDQIFRGDQPLSRHEFAAGLATCLGQISPEAGPDRLTLLQLTETFQTELEALDEQIDHLEAQTTILAANQFSTTTHLSGQAIFALLDAAGEGIDVNPTFGTRLRLNFNTSLTGHDLLITTLGANNVARLDRATGFNETRLGFDGDTNGKWDITTLKYQFPISDPGRAVIGVKGVGMTSFATTHNPFLSGSGGALSRFAQRNPIYRVPHAGAGVGVQIHFTDNLSLDLGYGAGEAESSGPGSGFFNGDYGALAQLNLQANPLHLGLTYIHSYSGTGRGLRTGTGSQAARLNKVGSQELERPLVGNSFGVEISYDLGDRVAVGGWIGYTDAQVLGLGRADVWNWAITLAFPDLGREGNLGGVLVGMQPRLTGTSSGLRAIGQFPDPDVGLHIEAFYRHEVNHRLSITPGFILLTAPDHDTRNAPILIGTIRTVLRF